MNQLPIDFSASASSAGFLAPSGYAGVHGFHKYWGKKPPETSAFLIDRFSSRGEIVFDPFLGSGAVARESLLRRRRFLGCDLNPAAIELSRMLVAPPRHARVASAFKGVVTRVRRDIESQYTLCNGSIASHYLWNGDELRAVWTKPTGSRSRLELSPTHHDRRLFEQFSSYQPIQLRPLHIYKNSRINAWAGMGWSDLFTGRAIRTIELIRSAILSLSDESSRSALLLALTASVGQMSNMVFAIERRGKRSDAAKAGRIEVGSWVIGFWKPELHFEVNAWNCFANKATRLLHGLRDENSALTATRSSASTTDVVKGHADIALLCGDACEVAKGLPDRSIGLVLTDPPHGDRIPYLELSEIWNSVLGFEVDFEKELVVSNAKERSKNIAEYSSRLSGFFGTLSPKLTAEGVVIILFNSRSTEEWGTLLAALECAGLGYQGRVPMAYSASSVVQDNREGALVHDYVVVFSQKSDERSTARVSALVRDLPMWSTARPE
jgi:DNA methylase